MGPPNTPRRSASNKHQLTFLLARPRVAASHCGRGRDADVGGGGRALRGGTPLAALTPVEIRRLLDSGVQGAEVIRLLVATGNWSNAGAADIVSFLTRGPDAFLSIDTTPRAEDERKVATRV